MVNRYMPFDAEMMEADLGGDYVEYAEYEKLETLLVDFARAIGEALIRTNGDSALETKDEWNGTYCPDGLGKCDRGCTGNCIKAMNRDAETKDDAAAHASYLKTRACEHDWQEIDAYPFRAMKCTKCGAGMTPNDRGGKHGS